MTNITQISLESLLLRAVNNTTTLDSAAVNAFYALINKEKDGVVLGVRALAQRLPISGEKEVISTLNILDMGMSKCGVAFQNEVGKFRFLNEMIKLVSPKYLGNSTPVAVKQRILQLLYLWTLDYPKEIKIKEAFDMLRKQGVIKDIPNPNLRPSEALGLETKKCLVSSIFQDEEKSNILKKLLQSKDPEDIQAANWLIKSMVKEDEKLTDFKSKTLNEVESAKNNIKLLNEMIECYKDGETTRNELDLMSELHDNLTRFKPNLNSMILSEESASANDDLLESALKALEDVAECSNKYSNKILNKNTESHLDSLLEFDQHNEDISLIQGDIKNSTNGSVNNGFTAKSSMEVLCDVFSNIGNSNEQSPNILQPSSSLTVFQNSDNLNGQSKIKNADEFKALEELDVLNEHLLKENLTPANSKIHEKIPLNILTKINDIKKAQQVEIYSDDNCLLENLKTEEFNSIPSSSGKSVEYFSQLDNGDDCLVDISEENYLLSAAKNYDNENLICPKLKDITVNFEDLRHLTKDAVLNLDTKNCLTVLFHRAQISPHPSINIFLISTISLDDIPITDYSFQPVVPEGCKLRLLPASSNELPQFDPFTPTKAINEILLIANPAEHENCNLKFLISFVKDGETVTEMGEVKKLTLKTFLKL